MRIFLNLLILLLAISGLQGEARGAATLLPNAEQCFTATTGINGMVGLLGAITGGSGGTAGTYGGMALTGGSGSGATANITVAGGLVTTVVILNPGTQYVVGDVLSASAATIGNTSGFSVPVSTVAINSSLAGGKVYFYYPLTNTLKTTWFNADASASHQNTNPVLLDANGCAIIYGTGTYRQVVQDSLSNTIWDQLTTDTSANGNIFWAGTAAGTPNVITIVDAGFNATDGSVIQFLPLFTNTSTATLNPSGFGAIPILKASATGPVALAAGDLVAGYTANVVYVAGTNSFQLLNPAPSASATVALSPPQGRLTLTSGSAVISSDVSGATALYYTPYVGNQIPIYNGSSFVAFTFAELTLTLTTNQLANIIYDVCIFSNSGSATAVIGPAWSNSAAGAGARGTGASSAQLQRLNGFWVNAVAMTGVNGASSFSIPVNQCTYVGSIYMDGTAGQITFNTGYGQNRKAGVWNAYNRVPIELKAGDPAASWTYTTATIRASNNVPAALGAGACNAGASACDGIVVFVGLAEEALDVSFTQKMTLTAGTTSLGALWNITNGLGFNSITAYTGSQGTVAIDNTSGAVLQSVQQTPTARYVTVPSIGIQTVVGLEDAVSVGGTGGTSVYFGTESNMVLVARWRG